MQAPPILAVIVVVASLGADRPSNFILGVR